MWQLCCARILLSVLRTLLHGAFPWLQPRSPVVQKVVERDRGPDPPEVDVEGQRSAPPNAALEARAERRGAVLGNPRPSARAVDANHRRGSRAVALPDEREERARAAVAALVVDRSLPWHV